MNKVEVRKDNWNERPQFGYCRLSVKHKEEYCVFRSPKHGKGLGKTLRSRETKDSVPVVICTAKPSIDGKELQEPWYGGVILTNFNQLPLLGG